MKKTELAYLAGFFDGEGCICISKAGKGYQCSVSVTNTNEWIIQLFRFNFGGHIHLNEHSKHNPKWHDAWQWRVTAKKADNAIKSLLPYLILKKPQAMLALQFQSRKRCGQYDRGERENGYDKNKIQEEAELILMKSYNRTEEV